MAMKRCPVCGEKYNDTYRECPFCEEEEYLREEEESRRPAPAGRRQSHGWQYNLMTPTLVVLIIIMAALLIYLLFGDKLGKGGEEDPKITVNDPVEPNPGGTDPVGTDPEGTDPAGTGPEGGEGTEGTDPEGSGGSEGNTGTMPEGGAATAPAPSAAETEFAVAAARPLGLTLNNTDFTRSVSEGTYQLRVSGGSGTYTWISEDPGIASVDSNGLVTPISSGNVRIVVTDGSKQATCIVRVKGGTAPAAPTTTPTAPTTPSTGSGGTNALNKTDFTRKISEGSYQLTVSGITTAITWSSSNTSVATVSGNGTVTPVGKGTATITASWDGHSLTCIIRVPG